MDFGVVLQTDPPARTVIDRMRAAEDQGFRYGWTFDSHVLWQEPFVIYSQILAATSGLMVGPMVTNPGTRDWSVIASLFATLNDMYGNRTVCGIGRGDSARRYIGQAPVTLATLSSAMAVIKGLAEGREVEHHGQPLRIPWVRDGSLPVWMAAYGPRALRLVGEQADGFILQTADPDIARWTFGSVRAAADAAALAAAVDLFTNFGANGGVDTGGTGKASALSTAALSRATLSVGVPAFTDQPTQSKLVNPG